MVTKSRLTICVFAKPPRAGVAKTRLAQAVGDDGAARLAQAFFEDTWAKVGSLAWARAILATTDPADPAWAGVAAADMWSQGDGDLGARMERVLRRALAVGDAAIALGTDGPLVAAAWLGMARKALQSHDAVIGPSDDGGFYLLGLRRCPPGLLSGVAWSTDRTRAETMAALARGRFSVTELPTTFDVDCPADLARLRREHRLLRRRAPKTAVVLDSLAEALSMRRL